MKSLIIIYFLLFSLGALGNYLSIRKNQYNKKAAWTKYFVYLAIVLFITFIFLLKARNISNLFAFCLTSIAILELIRVFKRKNLNKYLFSGIAFTLLFLISFLTTKSNNLLLTYFLVFCFDGFSQLSGQLIGGKKMVPTISPNKSWSGFFGGMIFTLIAFLLVNSKGFGNGYFEIKVFLIVIPSILGGFFGDLFTSFLKRKAQVKDFADYIPGHGGLLDRMDSFFGAIILQSLFLFIYKLILFFTHDLV